MNLQIKIGKLDRQIINHITNQFLGLDLEVKEIFLVKGRPVKTWKDEVNGLTLKLNGKPVLHLNKTKGILALKHIPQEHHKTLMDFFKNNKLIEKPDIGFGIGLTMMFWMIATFLIIIKTSNSLYPTPNVVYVLIGALISSILGLILLGVTRPKNTYSDPLMLVSMVLYSIGSVVYVPSSLLTIPLVRSLIQNRHYYLFYKP